MKAFCGRARNIPAVVGRGSMTGVMNGLPREHQLLCGSRINAAFPRCREAPATLMASITSYLNETLGCVLVGAFLSLM